MNPYVKFKNYNREEICIALGSQVSAMGNCGMTKDTIVIGELRSIDNMRSVGIVVNDRDIPCSVLLKSIKELV